MKLQREYCVENHYEVGPRSENGYYNQYGENSYHPVYKERSDYYEKKFKDGLLIYETNNTEYLKDGNVISTRIIRYDKDSRIIKEFVSKLESVQGFDAKDIRFEINYEYNGESYRKIIKKTYEGTENLDYNDMFYKEIDQIESILEVKIINGEKIFEKYISFIDGTNRQTKYIYGEETGLLFVIDGYHEVEGQICFNSKYVYEKSDYKSDYRLREETHFNQKGDICLQQIFRKGNLIEKLTINPYYDQDTSFYKYIKTSYEDGLEKEIKYIYEGSISSGCRFSDSKITFDYDDQKNLIKKEYYDYSKDLPYKMEIFLYESIKVNNQERQVNTKIITKEKRISINESIELITPHSNENADDFIITKQIEYNYYSQGDLYQVKNYTQDRLYELITYSREGNKIVEIVFQNNDEDPPYKTINFMEEYDTEGNITKKITIEILDSRIQKETIINYSYEFDQPSNQGSNHYFSVRNDHCNFPNGFQPLKL